MTELAKKIEALLFVSGEGLGYAALEKQLTVSRDEIMSALEEIKAHLERDHALTLMSASDRVTIVTGQTVSKVVEDFAKEEFAGELTRAGLETLAVIAYKGPIKRSEIDYIRGVNSSFMIRNLLMRGLIERTKHDQDARAFFYQISPDFLKFLGISSRDALPDFGSFQEQLGAFIKNLEPHGQDNQA
jgi:segregation and condensation protein B